MRERIAARAAVAAVLAVLAAGSVAPAAASASPVVQGPPPPGNDWVEIVASNGSGCQKAGDVRVSPSNDRDAFTITYGDFTVRAGGSSAPLDWRRYCQIVLKVRNLQGFTWAVTQQDFWLGAVLQKGAKATLKDTFYWQGQPEVKISTQTLVGPYDGDHRFIGTVTQPNWKPCGEERTFNISMDLRAELGTSDSSKVSHISMNRDNGGGLVYRLGWKRC